jgi:hypothetical protein
MFRLARYVALNGLLARNDLLVKDPDDHGQYRYLADNQRSHFDRIVRASLNHLRPDDEVHSAVMRIRCKPKDAQLWACRSYFEFQI